MNVRCLLLKSLVLAIAALAPVSVMAQSSTPAPAPSSTMMIHCTYGTWPTRDQVASHLRFPSVRVGEVDPTESDAPVYVADAQMADDVRQLQQFIRRQGRQACEHGASHVQVDFHPHPGRRVAVVAAADQ